MSRKDLQIDPVQTAERKRDAGAFVLPVLRLWTVPCCRLLAARLPLLYLPHTRGVQLLVLELDNLHTCGNQQASTPTSSQFRRHLHLLPEAPVGTLILIHSPSNVSYSLILLIMNTSRYRFPAKLAPGIRRLRAGSLSTSSSRTVGSVTERSSFPKRQASFVASERLSFCEEDLLDIDPSDIVEANSLYRPQIDWLEPATQRPGELKSCSTPLPSSDQI